MTDRRRDAAQCALESLDDPITATTDPGVVEALGARSEPATALINSTRFTAPGVLDFAEEIDRERQRQITEFGDQRHPDNTGSTFYAKRAVAARRNCRLAADAGMTAWDLVLLEEVFEALAESDPAKLRAELLQVAAVCAAWIHDIDQRPATDETAR